VVVKAVVLVKAIGFNPPMATELLPGEVLLQRTWGYSRVRLHGALPSWRLMAYGQVARSAKGVLPGETWGTLSGLP
jgi:hypothetical protein